jgi:CubicO group peptidase (beta-lactamase class C family)
MKIQSIVESCLPAIALFLCVQAVVATASACETQRDAQGSWKVAENATENDFDATKLCDVLKRIVHGQINFHGVVVERNGKPVGEAYRRGKDESIYTLFASTKDFDADTLHDIRSISKSIVSLLWGIAVEQKKALPLDKPALDFFPQLDRLRNSGRETITLEHLFTMSSGLKWREVGHYGAFGNDETGLYWHSSQAKYLFDREMIEPAGTRFNYNGGGTAVMAQLLEQRVGMPLPDYARKFLFEPLGIEHWEWKNDVRGRPLAFAGLRMRPTDLARIGNLVLAHGVHEGKQIVSREWLDQSTRPHIEADKDVGYGFFWWTSHVEALDTQRDLIFGTGNGGEKLFLVPSLDLVVVITAGDYNRADIHRAAQDVLNAILATLRSPTAPVTVPPPSQ